MPKPHRIDATEMATFLSNLEVEFASSTTADRTQRKRACRKGDGTYIITRAYLTVLKWETVYSGPDLEEAVRVYNQLS